MPSKKEIVLKDSFNRLSSLLESKIESMPKGFNKQRFIQNCMAVLQDTKGIENCNPGSVVRTLIKGAYLDLDFFQKECYAIPYGNEIQFQTDYKGEVKIAKKYSIRPIKDIYAKIVREGDEYSINVYNGEQSITFNPIPFNNGNIIGAFAVCLYKDGGIEVEEMSKQEIEDIRNNFSRMKNSLMWTKTPTEAYKKTVLRRLAKHIEKDFNTQQIEAYNEASGLEFKDNKEVQKAINPFEDEEIIDADFKENENNGIE